MPVYDKTFLFDIISYKSIDQLSVASSLYQIALRLLKPFSSSENLICQFGKIPPDQIISSFEVVKTVFFSEPSAPIKPL